MTAQFNTIAGYGAPEKAQLTDANLTALGTAANPLVTTPAAGTSLPSAPITGQAKIAVTGTAVQLPANAITRRVTIKAASSINAAGVFIGSATVTRTDDGTGNGYKLAASETIALDVQNTNDIWFNGTAGDIIYFLGY